ncbi:MAG TPA: hypothetical protein VFP23_07410, partial [Solirubrobacterales bacterium]|nr:hypothetical protein [Solirubrobacterales bacterium]
DAPVSKFTLSLPGGSKGLIVNSESLCANPGHAEANFDAHNGKINDSNPLIKTDCGGKGHKHGGHGKHHKRH